MIIRVTIQCILAVYLDRTDGRSVVNNCELIDNETVQDRIPLYVQLYHNISIYQRDTP